MAEHGVQVYAEARELYIGQRHEGRIYADANVQFPVMEGGTRKYAYMSLLDFFFTI